MLATAGHITIKCTVEIVYTQMKNPNDIDDTLTFHLGVIILLTK